MEHDYTFWDQDDSSQQCQELFFEVEHCRQAPQSATTPLHNLLTLAVNESSQGSCWRSALLLWPEKSVWRAYSCATLPNRSFQLPCESPFFSACYGLFTAENCSFKLTSCGPIWCRTGWGEDIWQKLSQRHIANSKNRNGPHFSNNLEHHNRHMIYSMHRVMLIIQWNSLSTQSS